MRVHKILLPLLLTAGCCSASANTIFYSFENAMANRDVRDILDPTIKLYFGTQSTPPLAEKSRPDSQTRSGISIAPFGRDPDVLCKEGFTRSLEALIRKARKMGFDTVFNIRGKSPDGTANNRGFDCSAGRRTSEVRLFVEFGLTEEGARRAQTERAAATLKPRKPPGKNAVFLPLADVMNSAEAKAMLGSIKAHWGASKMPAYTERFGPEAFEGEANVVELGREGACKKAVLNALAEMLQEASGQGYNSLIGIRSDLDEQLAPNEADFECEVGSKWASVRLQALLATVP